MLGLTSQVAHPLSFVRINSDGTKNFWSPERTNDYQTDCAAGRAAAEELVEYVRETRNAQVFGSIVRAMTASGVYEAFEIGFCAGIGIIVCVG